MYLPRLTSRRVAKVYTLGDRTCVVCTDCQSDTMVRYTHVMFVQRPSEPSPTFAVAAEVNAGAQEGRAVLARLAAEGMDPEELARNAALIGSHVLGVFPGEGHENWGSSDEWADLDKFTARALALVAERFSITTPPVEQPVSAAGSASKPTGATRTPRPPPSPKKWWQFWK